jgi:GntP family gluconate:H+ symporter
VVSIPVFCDSGFVILNPIRKALSARTGRSSVACTVALGSGLLLSHCLIPPTPGPLAVAGTLYGVDGLHTEVDLLTVMGVGALCSILPFLLICLLVRRLGKTPDLAAPEELDAQNVPEQSRPSAFWAFAPIAVPIILMGLASLLETAGHCPDVLYFLGQPMAALTVGLLLGLLLLRQSALPDKAKLLRELTEDTLRTGGPILFITAAGGVLGAVIKNTNLVQFVADNAGALEPLGFAFPFLIAAALKCAQGSSTVAMTTTAGIVAPLMTTLGWTTPMSAALLTAAIGGGSMLVSHANDSFFWVVTGFGGLDVKTGYRTYTVATLLCGLSVLAGVLLLSALFL